MLRLRGSGSGLVVVPACKRRKRPRPPFVYCSILICKQVQGRCGLTHAWQECYMYTAVLPPGWTSVSCILDTLLT